MTFSIGSFAGGAADGYRKQMEEQRKKEAADREKKVQDRQDKEWQKQDAYEAERASVKDPAALYQEQMATWEKAQKESVASAAADTAIQEIQKNPAASLAQAGIPEVTPGQGTGLPQSFSADTEQRQSENPLATKPRTQIALGGIGGDQAMRDAIAKPEPVKMPDKPREPGVADQLDYLTRMAAIDLKHGKLSGAGMMGLVQARQQMTQEGMREALLQIHAGNAEEGIKQFNGYGNSQVNFVSSRPVVTDLGGGVKMPTYEVTVAGPDGKQQTINAALMLNGMRKMDGQISNAIELMTLNERKRHDVATEADSAKYHAGLVGAREDKAAGKSLTVPQQRLNAEIQAAREYVAGMSEHDIQKRTAQYSATGRENPDFDPMLSAKWKLANRRKYGEDAEFAGGQPAPTQPKPQPQGAAQPVAQPAPQKIQAGAVVDGYRFKGGNPNDPNAWEVAQ